MNIVIKAGEGVLTPPPSHRFLPVSIDGSNIILSHRTQRVEGLQQLVEFFRNCPSVAVFVNEPEARVLGFRLPRSQVHVIPKPSREAVTATREEVAGKSPVEIISKLMGVAAKKLRRLQLHENVMRRVADFLMEHDVSPFASGVRNISLDDLFVVMSAVESKGFVISNDMFTNLKRYRKWLPFRLSVRASYEYPSTCCRWEVLSGDRKQDVWAGICSTLQPIKWPSFEAMVEAADSRDALPSPSQLRSKLRSKFRSASEEVREEANDRVWQIDEEPPSAAWDDIQTDLRPRSGEWSAQPHIIPLTNERC